ncbi:MAG TPA: DUF2231 domain-containing protein [Chloroflexota bacterium]|nr:DUF2231 domain-containing protein [Chloroflexota bacterium]
MESKAKLAGHPIHPMLIVFPLGLLVMAVIFDLIAFFAGSTQLFVASYWMIAAGIIGGLAAAVFGFIDWLAIPGGTRAKGIGLWHGLGNVVVVALFAVAWWLRMDNGAVHESGISSLGLEVVAILIGTVTGWLGGELVDRLGVGVDRGAHLNSPSSLSGRPAYDGVIDDHSTVVEPTRRVA